MVGLTRFSTKEKAARENPGREGVDPGLGCKWWIFVELIQIIWERGEIPEQMSWILLSCYQRVLEVTSRG
jgi:hypothetical protein